MKNTYYIERQHPEGWHIISECGSEKPTLNRAKLSIRSYDGHLISKCSCKKPSNELRYDPGVTYITCACDTKYPRSCMADWTPKEVVRHWNATGYISLQKKY
jgi:hypothetical protein